MIGQPYLNERNLQTYGKTESIILSTGQNTVEKQLGFLAHGVIVDNLTNQWIFLREFYAFVAPYLSGRQIPISGAQKVSVGFGLPIGFNNSAVIPGQLAVVRFTEDVVPASPGVAVAPSTTITSVAIDSGGGINAGASVTVLAGVAGQSIYLYTVEIEFSAAQNNLYELQDSTGVNLWALRSDVVIFHQMNFGGAQLPVGRGLRITNVQGINGNADVTVTAAYSQH